MLSEERVEELKNEVVNLAGESSCGKRKVGALIVDEEGIILSVGINHSDDPDLPCEDEAGKTLPNVIHAEQDAINHLRIATEAPRKLLQRSKYMVVTHAPCVACLAAIRNTGIDDVIVAESFMKFDVEKLRYDLVPPSAIAGLAEVLTYGAKKYKPNNWREVDDTDRYIAALYRHLEAWRAGEKCDDESKLQHLKHAMTNIAFLLEFENNEHS